MPNLIETEKAIFPVADAICILKYEQIRKKFLGLFPYKRVNLNAAIIGTESEINSSLCYSRNGGDGTKLYNFIAGIFDSMDRENRRENLENLVRRNEHEALDLGEFRQRSPNFHLDDFQRLKFMRNLLLSINYLTGENLTLSQGNLVEIVNPNHVAEEMMGRKLFSKSIDAYDLWIECDKQNHAPYFYRGRVKAVIGMKEEAIRDFDNSLKLVARGTFPPYYLPYLRGNARLFLGMFEEAVEDFKKVLSFGLSKQDSQNISSLLREAEIRAVAARQTTEKRLTAEKLFIKIKKPQSTIYDLVLGNQFYDLNVIKSVYKEKYWRFNYRELLN